jgi:amidase
MNGGVDLVGNDATVLAEMVRTRTLSARGLVDATLQRIADLEPQINAFRVVLNRAAREDAERIDSLSEHELADLPLAGVPVAIKDDTDVTGESTMWGSAVDRGTCERDADVVGRLRRAGAVIIGKTNVPELTLWPWTASKAWGVTRNPWDLDRTPGGSSGGSAAAVCTGMAAIALGSDGGGSIRYPAGLTGLVGLKTGRDQLPLGPEHGTGWHGLISLGPLTRSARDAALFLDVTAHPEPVTTARDALDAPMSPLRMAVSTNAPPGTLVSLAAERRTYLDDASAALAALGHEVFEVEIDYGLALLWNSTVRMLQGARSDVQALPDRQSLERRTRRVARLAGLIPQRSLRRAIGGAVAMAETLRHSLDGADIVITPLCEAPAPHLTDCPSTGALRSLRAADTSAWLAPWNAMGMPAVSVPTGIDPAGLPLAVHLAAFDGDEASLLRAATRLQQALPTPPWSPAVLEHTTN